MDDASSDWTAFISSPGNSSCVISGPTQMGKTNACIAFASACIDRRLPVLLSCDNRSDQLDQTFSRFQSFFSSRPDVSILRVDDRRFETQLETSLRSSKRCVVFLLNNNAQVERLRIATRAAIVGNTPSEDVQLDSVVLIHDEGDVVIKDPSVSAIRPRQPESHKAWIQYCTFLSQRFTLKRAFLSATPECVNYMVDATVVISLISGDGYVGYRHIQYTALPEHDGADDENANDLILPMLYDECRRMKEGAILYCVNRRIEDGHDTLFTQICEEVDRNVIVHTYNGKGIVARVVHPRFVPTLAGLINEMKLTKTKIQSTLTSPIILTIENVPVSEFYEACRRLQLYKIITIGYDLMSRGISFVSSGRAPDTIAATTMFYKPGKTMHAVGICQAVGRITGRARPDMERKLFAPRAVIQKYLAFNMNQEVYIPRLVASKRTTKETMSAIVHPHRMTGPIDRPNLQLKPKYGRARTTIDIEAHNRAAREMTRQTIEKMEREKQEQEQESRRNIIAGVNLQTLHTDISKNTELDMIITLFRKNGWKRLTMNAIRTKIANLEFLNEWIDSKQKGKLFILSDDEKFLEINPTLITHVINS